MCLIVLKLWDWSASTLVRLWLPLGLCSIPKGDGLSLTNLSGFGWARDGGVSPRSSQSGVLRAGFGLCIMYTGLKTRWKLLIKLFSKNMGQAQLQSIILYWHYWLQALLFTSPAPQERLGNEVNFFFTWNCQTRSLRATKNGLDPRRSTLLASRRQSPRSWLRA